MNAACRRLRRGKPKIFRRIDRSGGGKDNVAASYDLNVGLLKVSKGNPEFVMTKTMPGINGFVTVVISWFML